MMRWHLRNLSVALLVVVGVGILGAGSAAAQNPVVIDTGRRLDGVRYDPWNDRYHVDTSRTRVRDSYFDWDRNLVDPGSRRYVDRPIYDAYGRIIGREMGWTWTSNGRPHGNLTRRTSTEVVPGVVVNNNTDNLHYSSRPGTSAAGRPGVSVNHRDRIMYEPAPSTGRPSRPARR